MSAATAITNVRVFDGERLGEPATVVVEDAMISARTLPDGARDAEFAQTKHRKTHTQHLPGA